MSKPRVFTPESCPYCGSETVDYSDSGVFGNTMLWTFECNECHKISTEVYLITYQYTDGEEDA